MGFIEVTRTGGNMELVNVDNIVSVRDRKGDKPATLTLTNGTDFEVSDSYEDLQAKLIAGSG